jgi:hypothetical protein
VHYFITFFSSKNGTEKRGKRFLRAGGKREEEEETMKRGNEEEKEGKRGEKGTCKKDQVRRILQENRNNCLASFV